MKVLEKKKVVNDHFWFKISDFLEVGEALTTFACYLPCCYRCNSLQLILRPLSENFFRMEFWGGGINPSGHYGFLLHQLIWKTFLWMEVGVESFGHFCLLSFILSHFQKYSSTFLGWRLGWWLQSFWQPLLSRRPPSSFSCSGLTSRHLGTLVCFDLW